ncbi:hypothetical protein GEMRC1_005714 [Eukaryota sp. GEM-RC1]
MVGIFKSVFDVELSARFYLNKATSVIKQEEDLDELEAYIDELIACGIVVFIHGCQSFSITNCRDYAFISLFFKSSVGQIRPAWSNQFLEVLRTNDNQFETLSLPVDLKFFKFVEDRETVRTSSKTPRQQGLVSPSPSQLEIEEDPTKKMGIVEYLDFQRLSFQARRYYMQTIEELRRFWSSLLEGSTSGSVTHIQRLPAISSRIVEYETEAISYFDSLITRFSYNPVVYRQAAQFARDVLADESMAAKLESSAMMASAPGAEDGKSLSGAGSVVESVAYTNSDGSIAGGGSQTTKETLLVGDSSHDGISNKARFYLRLLSFALISSAILLFLLHSSLITSYQDHISAHESLTKLNYQTGFVQALGSVSSSRYDLLNFTVLSESSRTIRDLLPVAFRRSSSVNRYWRTSVKDLIDIEHHLDFSRFSLQSTFYDMFREISREVLNVQSLTEPNQITLFKDLSNLFEFYLSPGFDTLLKQLTPSLQSSRFILSVFVLSLLIFCLALCVITFVKLAACFTELNQNRASAIRLFLEIDRSIALKSLQKLDDIAKRSKIQGNYSSKFDAMSNRTELTSAERTKMLSGKGVSSSENLKKLKNFFIVTLTSVVTIVLVFSLLFFNQIRVTNPMMENFEVSNSLVTQNSLIFSNSMTNSSNTHSYLNHAVFKLNNLLSGHLVLDASSSFCSPDTFNLNDFDLSIPSYTTLLSLESEASDFYFSPTSCVAVNDSTCPSLTNPELFSLYYYNWFFLAQSCHSGAPSLFLSVYTSLFQSSTRFSEIMVQFALDSLTEFSNVRLTSLILFVIAIIVLRYTFFASISNKIFSDSISTRRMLKMVPAECRDQNLISWDSSLEIGIDWVDAQHKVLVDIMNAVYKAAMIDVKSKKVLSDALYGLLDYTKNHFAAEEEFFDATDYPGAQSHKAYHRKLEGQVLNFYEKFEKGETQIDMSLMTFLRNWLLNHILKSDRAYVEWHDDHKYRGTRELLYDSASSKSVFVLVESE